MTSGETTLELIRIFVLLVGAAAIGTLLARRFRLPYTVALVAFGLIAGTFAQGLSVQITPELVLVVLLPALVFEASYQTDFAKLRPALWGVFMLAGPGVLISAAVIAAALHFGAGFEIGQAFVVGAMLSATDPAAVIATFKRLSSPKRLSTLVEAESVFNDGTGIVAFAIAVAYVAMPVGPVEIGFTFFSVALVSTALGAVAGYAASRILPTVGDHLIEISLSVVLAYGTYLAADALHLSGVIATAVAGIVLGNYGRSRGLMPKTVEALDTVWEFVAFLATAFIFLVVGFAIPLHTLASAAVPIAWAIGAALVGRAFIIYVLLNVWRESRRWWRILAARRVGVRPNAQPPARKSRAADQGPWPFDWLHVVFWSGLRGAVSTALALSLPVDFPNREQLQAVTFGVVLFTLVVQATTADVVVVRWGQKPKDSRTARNARRVAETASQQRSDGSLHGTAGRRYGCIGGSGPDSAVDAVSEVRQRWRIVFARGEEARYLSHLDAVKGWERAFRRGDIPIATTEGFSPRSKLVFAAPLQLGMLAERDLADLFLAERLTSPNRARLTAGMPNGYTVVGMHDVWSGAPALATQLVAADYRMTLLNVERAALAAAVERLMAAERLPRQRRKESRSITYDLRPLLLELRVGAPDADADAGLWMRLRHSQNDGSGRPDEVVAALADELGMRTVPPPGALDDEAPGTASGEAPTNTAAGGDVTAPPATAAPVLEVLRPVRERLWLDEELAPKPARAVARRGRDDG